MTAADELTAANVTVTVTVTVTVGASGPAGRRFIGSVAVRPVEAGRRPVSVVP